MRSFLTSFLYRYGTIFFAASLFMQREGTCGNWFMHSIGIYRTGCTYGTACVNRHERPSIEPPENSEDTAVDGTPVATMTTGAVPNTNGAKPVLMEMQEDEGREKIFTILPHTTNGWINSNKVWMQPDDDADLLCGACDEEHSYIKPCQDGGNHSLLLHEMACALAVSAVERDKPFRWMANETQNKVASKVQSNSVLATGTREISPLIFVPRPSVRPRGDTRFCFSLKTT